VRQRLKLILFAALSAALTVAGLSIAAGGGSSESSGNDARPSGDVKRAFKPAPGLRMRFDRFDQDVEDVMRQIHDAVEAKSAEIAEPIIQKAEDAGDITGDQADRLREFVKADGDRKPPSSGLRALLTDKDVRNVLTDVLEAKAKQTPDIAGAIIDKAASDKKITSAQADDIRERVKHAPFFFPGRFLEGHGPGGRHERGPFKLGKFDRDVGAVMRDIHAAVERKAPEIAGPVIDKAEQAGDITSAQADQLRKAAQSIANGDRPGADLRSLLDDADVRTMVHDAFAAAHKQAPAIAGPIIDKAVQDKKITSAQADDIRAALKRGPRLHIAPPPPGAPGVFPGDAGPSARPAVLESPA
jgi:hypothetical protein